MISDTKIWFWLYTNLNIHILKLLRNIHGFSIFNGLKEDTKHSDILSFILRKFEMRLQNEFGPIVRSDLTAPFIRQATQHMLLGNYKNA